MLEESALKDWLPSPALSRGDKLLLVLAVGVGQPKTVKFVRELTVGGGERAAKKWNVSSILLRTPGAVHTKSGWELNQIGRDRVVEIVGPLAQPKPQVAAGLRTSLAKIANEQTHAFVDEAVRCYEAHLFKASVVLSWVGAVSVLYNEVVSKHLARFNAEAQRRDPKWRPAVNSDGLAKMKEAEFLDVLEYLSIIGKNVKEELQICLKLRNGCGHPSSLRVAENRVAAHIETLILNVFSIFT